MAVNFEVSVMPGVNRIHLGETATFECIVTGNLQIDQYAWVGSEKIAKEERFSYDDETKRFLHVNNVKAYDNGTWVDCTATAVGGRIRTGSGRIVALPKLSYNNDSMTDSYNGEIPPLTAGGGVVIAFSFILVAAAMFGVLWWLKRKEIQKQEDVEASRSRYSRIEPSSPTARYNRDVDNVMLAQHGRTNSKDYEDGDNDDCYEDMLPVVPKRIKGNSPRDSPPRGSPPRGSPPRGSPVGSPGNSRYPPPRK